MASTRPLKRYCASTGEYGVNVPSDRYRTDGVRLVRTSDVTDDGVLRALDDAVFVEEVDAEGLFLAPGDLLFSRSGTLGRALLYPGSTTSTTFAGYLVRFRARGDVDPRFLYYVSRSATFLQQIDADAIQSTIGNFNAEKYGNLRVPELGFSHQCEIADFLDAETARIGALIEKKRQMVDLLEERKSLLFVNALEVRGFRWGSLLESPAADRDVPSGWMLAHLSTVLEQLTNGYVGPTRDVLVDSGAKYIQSLHIKDGEIDFARGAYYVPREWHDARPRIHLRPGDVLIVQTGDIGQVAVVPDDFGPASCHALQIARVRRELLTGEYLGAYLRSPFGRQSLLSRVTGALHPHLEGGIRDIPIIVPPLATQSEIVDELRKRASPIDRLRLSLARQMDLLREHRQALITAAVIGELDVAKAAA